jgi:hypothetical protein
MRQEECLQGELPNGLYKTAAGSTLRVFGKHGGCFHVDFDWLEEGGCIDCSVSPCPDDGYMIWSCDYCGGGHAKLETVKQGKDIHSASFASSAVNK